MEKGDIFSMIAIPNSNILTSMINPNKEELETFIKKELFEKKLFKEMECEYYNIHKKIRKSKTKPQILIRMI